MIRTHTFSNGLRLVVENIPYVRSVSMGIMVGTGSRYETTNNNGISHFIEHMLFKGTEKRSARDIAEAFDTIGGNINAFTSKEYTCFYAKVTDEHVLSAFDIMADMYFHSVFHPQEMEKEKNVILEEWHMVHDTPDEYIYDLIDEATFHGHPLGFNVLGRVEVLHALTPSDLHAYMDLYYTPANTVIAMAGNIDDAAAVELVSQYFGQFRGAGQTFETEVPVVTTERKLVVKKTEQAHLSLGLHGLPSDDDRLFALMLLNNVLGGSMSSRLFQEVREERGLAYAIYSYHNSYKDTGTLQIYAGTSTDHVEQVYEHIMRIMAELARTGVTDKEFNNTKQQLRGDLVLSLESSSSRMSHIGRNELLLGRQFTVEELIGRIEAIRQDEVNELAASLFEQGHSLALISPLDLFPPSMPGLTRLGGKKTLSGSPSF